MAEEESSQSGTTSRTFLKPSVERLKRISESSFHTLSSSVIVERIVETVPKWSRRQWLLCAAFAWSNFIAGIIFSLKGPFYPHEAELKGVTPAQYGFVFGIFDFTKVIICPLYGKYVSVLGARRVYITSMTLVAICSVCFGLLDKVDGSVLFLSLSFFIRVMEAVGSAGYTTSSFALVASEFPHTVATSFASLETFFGIGLIVGPLIGGLLYQVGGYDAPFIIIGVMFSLTAIVLGTSMPALSEVPTPRKSSVDGKIFDVWSAFKIPGVMLALFGVFTLGSSSGFINATLEPHIRQFNPTPVQIGLIFIIYGFVYAVTAPAWGWVCDRVSQPGLITLVGAICNFAAFLLVGPAPFLVFGPLLWLTCVALCLHGVALGAIFVSGFVLSLRYTVANGFPNNMTTYGVVSGLWTSMLSLGMFLGPVIGGILLEKFGFRWASLYIIVTMLLLIVLIVLFLSNRRSEINSKEVPTAELGDEKQPLLNSKDTPDYGCS